MFVCVCVCARTYFVEYQFPVVATSRDKQQPIAMATEVMRVVSKKVSDTCKCNLLVWLLQQILTVSELMHQACEN